MQVGTIESIFRYPLKSAGGESPDTIDLGLGGIPGDRSWAIRDEVRGGIVGAKRFSSLMQFSSRLVESSPGGSIRDAEITFPDGQCLSTSEAGISEKISEVLGQAVTLWPLIPASELDHYRRGQAVHDDMETELRAIFGRTAGESLPDLSTFPPEVLHFASPPGTYFDAFPLLVMTSTSLSTLASKAAGSRYDVRRFRPNFLISGADESRPFPESEWCGKRLRMGEAEIEVVMECPRCVMTTHGFGDLPNDPGIMRTLVREAGGNLGVYANPVRAGRVQTGDVVELLTA